MRAGFYDAALVQHGDPIGIANGRDPMRDEDGGSPAHHLTQMVENLVFGVGVDAGERIIENKNARVANQSAGNCGALLLSS